MKNGVTKVTTEPKPRGTMIPILNYITILSSLIIIIILTLVYETVQLSKKIYEMFSTYSQTLSSDESKNEEG